MRSCTLAMSRTGTGHLATHDVVRFVSVPDEALCRCRLPKSEVPTRAQEGLAARQARDRETLGSGKRVRYPAQALDRGAHLCLARTMPQTGEGLGEPQLQGARLLAPRFHPPHAEKALKSHMMFPDRL